MKPIRTLSLSGGGGRGAFHAGVYNYLLQAHKPGVDAAHQGAWSPDIIVGTSIGAVNGAAIAQGISAPALEAVWLSLREHDIQSLPPGMRVLSRWFVNRFLKQAIGCALPSASPADATSPIPPGYWPPLPFMPRRLAEWLIGRWINLLDTSPLRDALLDPDRFGIDEQKLAQSDTTLLITATNVQTGERTIFSNREIVRRSVGEPRADVVSGITVQRILASCSIIGVNLRQRPQTSEVFGTKTPPPKGDR